MNTEAPRVLVVEDERDIRDLVAFALRGEGYEVDAHATGEAGLAAARDFPPDMAVLDIMLPGLDGLALCRKLRAHPATRRTPILLLTARGAPEDIVEGLDSGADDYVAKPFVPEVLAARVRSALRRTGRLSGTAGPRGEDDPWVYGELSVHPSRFEATLAGDKLDLTTTEFRLLLTLAAKPGRVFTRNQLLEALRGPHHAVTDRAVDAQVVALRRKLGDYGHRIETVRGVGYRFTDTMP